MKRSLWAIVICGLACFASCSDMLETKSNSYLDADDNRLNSANDSLYSVVGIMKQLQQLGERYVVLGELRGELTDITPNAGMDLQAIADFTATAGNPYLSTREYYAIINNCNYFLKYVDTTVVAAGKKVMFGEYAMVKTARDWAYLQLGLNYGKAVWVTEPILNIADMNRQYEELTLEDLLPRLISDMETIAHLRKEDIPQYGIVNGRPLVASLIDPGSLRADLYLWYGVCTGDPNICRTAAYLYYDWFTGGGNFYAASIFYNMYFDGEFTSYSGSRWNRIYGNNPMETVSMIRYNNNVMESSKYPPVTTLCLPTNTAKTYMIKPSQAAIDLWKNEIYTFYRKTQNDVIYTKGDLRGQARTNAYNDPLGSYDYTNISGDSVIYITKYGYYSGNTRNPIYNITLNREGLMYLRYAEALNAVGKPSLAFAVLKYGMKAEVLTDRSKVAPDEINPLPAYCDFMDPRFSSADIDNYGFHTRGSGNAGYDTVYYAFTPQTLAENRAYYGFPEKLETKTDSMLFVNAMLCKEYGMETAFEGNRFHDLMRLSRQYERLTGKSDFLAKWVARRNPALESKLANRGNWYLPAP